jgi:HAE1 family hydrophobic/amphiphilic exporter-1
LGVAVFFGMIGVTTFGLLFTPSFYVISRQLGDRASNLLTRRKPGSDEPPPSVPLAPEPEVLP